MISDVLADVIPELDVYLSDEWPGWRPEGELLERVLDLRARMIGLRVELDTLRDDGARFAVFRNASVIARNLNEAGARWLADDVGGDLYVQLGGSYSPVADDPGTSS